MGSCQVVCQVTQACDCGVKQITLDSVLCQDCNQAQDCRNTAVGCAEGFSCLPIGELWECVKRDGEGCSFDNECLSGYCDNGLCCEKGDCCVSPTDCPERFSEAPSCDLATCTGSFVEALCEANQCVSRPRQDAAVCEGALVDTCGDLADVLCRADGQAPASCRASCDTTVDCDEGFVCSDGACLRARANGEACDDAAVCRSGRCNDGFCCEGGECCGQPSDCDSVQGREAICDAPAICGGRRMEVTCLEGQCGLEEVPDDRACTAQTNLNAACRLNVYQPCNGAEEQIGLGCDDSCLTDGQDDDSKCVIGASCIGGECVACTACEGNLTVRTLGDMEQLAGCGSITGSLSIQDYPGQSLVLGCLTSVSGHLSISRSDNLTHLAFPNLTRTGSLSIHDMPALESLRVDRLTSTNATNSISISNNGALTSLDLSSLQSNVNSVTISDNDALASFDLSSLESISMLDLSNNDALTFLDLGSLESAYSFVLSDNGALTSLELSSLRSLVSLLKLSNNNSLTSVSLPGLTNAKLLQVRHNTLNAEGPSFQSGGTFSNPQIVIEYNDALTSLDLGSIQNNVTTVVLSNNAVLTSLDLSSVLAVTSSITISDNDALASLDLSSLASIPTFVLSDNGALTSLELSSLRSITSGLILSNNNALPAVSLPAIATVKSLQVRDNTPDAEGPSFQSGGMSNNPQVVIEYNDVLATVSLNVQNGANSSINIRDNAALIGMDGSISGAVQQVNVLDNLSLCQEDAQAWASAIELPEPSLPVVENNGGVCE